MLEMEYESIQQEAAEEEEKKRTQAEQSVRIASGIGQAGTLIDTVTSDAEIMELLLAQGVDEALISEGRELLARAQGAFAARSSAMSAQYYASQVLSGREAEARKAFIDFRIVARALFRSEAAASTALSLNGQMPTRRGELIALATAAVQNAQEEPYAQQLARFGYDEQGLARFGEAVNALQAADAVQNNAIGDAMTATVERDQAWSRLNEWMIRFRALAKATLRDQPDLYKLLEV
jgi:hypothetical protein